MIITDPFEAIVLEVEFGYLFQVMLTLELFKGSM